MDVADAELGLLLADALADQSLLRQVLSSDSNRSRFADGGLAGGKEGTLEVSDRSPFDQFRNHRPVHRSRRLAAGCGYRPPPWRTAGIARLVAICTSSTVGADSFRHPILLGSPRRPCLATVVPKAASRPPCRSLPGHMERNEAASPRSISHHSDADGLGRVAADPRGRLAGCTAACQLHQSGGPQRLRGHALPTGPGDTKRIGITARSLPVRHRSLGQHSDAP